MHFLHTLEFIFVNHLDLDDDDGDVEMHAGEWADGWLHFHLSLHNIWIRNCIQFEPRKCPEVAKRGAGVLG